MLPINKMKNNEKVSLFFTLFSCSALPYQAYYTEYNMYKGLRVTTDEKKNCYNRMPNVLKLK